MSNRINIGLDLDGTLADLIGAACERYNEKIGRYIEKFIHSREITTWDAFQNKTGFSHLVQRQWFNDTWQDWEKIHATNLVLSGITSYLREHANVFILSHRNPVSHEYVVKWLQKNKVTYDGLCLVEDHIDKLTFPIDILIDDHPQLAAKASDKQILLVDRPWNNSIIDAEFAPNVTRIHNLMNIQDWMKRNGHDSTMLPYPYST